MNGCGAGLEGGFHVEDRLANLVLDVDQRGGFAGSPPGGGGHGRQHVADVAGLLALRDHQWPVGEDEALVARAGDLLGRDHADNAGDGLCPAGVDPAHEGPRVRGERDRPVEHPRDGHVADEREPAQDKILDAIAIGAGSDAGHLALAGRRNRPNRWNGRLAAPGGGDSLHRVEHLDVARAPAQVAGQRPGQDRARRRPARARASPPP